MKHLFLIAISLLLFSCSGKPKTENKQEVSAQGDRVEVIYFHGKQLGELGLCCPLRCG